MTPDQPTQHGDDGGDGRWRICVTCLVVMYDMESTACNCSLDNSTPRLVEVVPKEQADHLEGELAEARRDLPRFTAVSYTPAVDFSGAEGTERMILAAACKLYESRGVSGETPDDYMADAEAALRAVLDRLRTDPNDPSPSGGGGEGELANEERSDVKAVSSQPSELREALGELANELERWGADNAVESKTEGDVPDEKYKTFQLSVDLIRAALATKEGQ